VTGASSITYIGFSQGSAQAFGAFSSYPDLAAKINLFIAMAPATKVNRLHHPMVDAFMRAKPDLAYALFGRQAVLPSTMFWRKIFTRWQWVQLLDWCQNFLFGWNCSNFEPKEKLFLYGHIFSFSSVKVRTHTTLFCTFYCV
jgi:lysosomal acid lipase/cholesteryl ester hydrolase